MTLVALVVVIVVIVFFAASMCAAGAYIAILLPGHPRLTARAVALVSAGAYLGLAPLLTIVSQR